MVGFTDHTKLSLAIWTLPMSATPLNYNLLLGEYLAQLFDIHSMANGITYGPLISTSENLVTLKIPTCVSRVNLMIVSSTRLSLGTRIEGSLPEMPKRPSGSGQAVVATSKPTI